ncbi:MAG: hypothetical protein GY847_19955 [Proteobacteria bacterium]|nr:hypothetical protein [Pseudomonadota bacterium]
MDKINKEIEEIKQFTEGGGYGDPEARMNDDRRLQILLHQDTMRWTRIKFLISLIMSAAALAISVIALLKD